MCSLSREREGVGEWQAGARQSAVVDGFAGQRWENPAGFAVCRVGRLDRWLGEPVAVAGKLRERNGLRYAHAPTGGDCRVAGGRTARSVPPTVPGVAVAEGRCGQTSPWTAGKRKPLEFRAEQAAVLSCRSWADKLVQRSNGL